MNRNRVLKRPFYPRQNEDVLAKVKNKHTIPKQAGEIRIIACDIAPEGGSKKRQLSLHLYPCSAWK